MPNKNRIEIQGHLGSDPVIETTPSGKEYARISVATSRYDKTKPKEDQVADWHKVVVFGGAVSLVRYLKKGDGVDLEGEVNYNKYTGSDGVERVGTSIKTFRVNKFEKIEKPKDDEWVMPQPETPKGPPPAEELEELPF